MSTTANADQIAYWNEQVGDTWASLQERMDAQLAPLGSAAIEALALCPGERVLDIGCGSGATTLQIAQVLGATGEAVGLDISRPMLAVAKSRPRPTDAAPVNFVEVDAQTGALPGPAFDAAFSRFGVMFFNDPVAAFRNIHAALKPGGRLAFVCWRPQPENPMFTAPMAAALKRLPAPPPADPLAPGPFAFADPERVRRILEEAGWSAIQIAPHDQPISPGTLEQAMTIAFQIGPLGAMLREHPDKRDAVVEDVRTAISSFIADGVVRFPSATWIVTANRA